MRSDDPKIIVQLAPSLLTAVDDFRFANRIESRAEAIRLLLQRGLDAKATAGSAIPPRQSAKARPKAAPAVLHAARRQA